jgi:hypothetical protein
MALATVASLARNTAICFDEGDFPVLEILVGKSRKQPQRRGSPLSQAISVRSSISTSRHVVVLFPQSRGSRPPSKPNFFSATSMRSVSVVCCSEIAYSWPTAIQLRWKRVEDAPVASGSCRCRACTHFNAQRTCPAWTEIPEIARQRPGRVHQKQYPGRTHTLQRFPPAYGTPSTCRRSCGRAD